MRVMLILLVIINLVAFGGNIYLFTVLDTQLRWLLLLISPVSLVAAAYAARTAYRTS